MPPISISTYTVIQAIKDNWENLLVDFEEEKRNRVGLTLNRLKENLVKVDFRFEDYKKIEQELFLLDKDPSSNPNYGEDLHYMQIKLVDRVEAFHQQVYSTLSVLAMVLTHLGFRINNQTPPISSIEKLLKALSDHKYKYSSVMQDQIYILEKSRSFRTKFVDHPQQHQIHDWYTYGFKGDYYLIFFIRTGANVYVPVGDIDPLSSDFKPPVDHSDFYVAPDKDRTQKALHKLITDLLSLS